VFEDHKDTVATVDLALATAMVEIRNTAPSVLSSPRTASMPMFRRALEAFVEFLRADAATHGPPAVFLCMACDFGSSMGSIVVHVLDGSRSLCEMHGVPGEWPANHKWVRRSDAKDATCFICKALLTREEGT
jgi:hypothetical protein